MRGVIESMLASDDAPPSLLNISQEALSTLVEDESEEVLPEQIGPYHVMGLIGRGGMGLVVKARRVDLPKLVALKLIGQRWFGPQLLERFRREQSVLARLQHPNIAQLLDAGRSEEGVPYFAMEYVDGVPINEYCDERQHDVRARLELFLDVCEAIQFAHRNLVVHRDLKPSNILVDTEGRVKLLDFGISKLLDDESQPLTVTEFRALTPSYASPEQIAGEAVTTSSDVYSLGVVLYELLVGARPYSLAGKSATEVSRILAHEVPRRPSTMVLEAESLSPVHRSFGRALKGDLDNIILKALEKAAATRYASVEALAADIRRYLEGLPVEARAATIGYRAGKFVMLHRWGVTVAAGLMLLLLAFAASVTYQQTQTARERDRAELEASKSERVTDFMLGLFRANDPSEALGDEVTARELLERGVERAELLSDQPVLQAETYRVVGTVYDALGQYEQARDLLERAIELQRTELGDEAPDLAESLGLLSSSLGGLRDLDGAIDAAAEGLRVAELNYKPPHAAIATSLNYLAEAYVVAARYQAADSLLNASHRMLVELFGEDDERTVATLGQRGTLLVTAGRNEEAEGVNKDVLAWQRRHLPAQHPEIAQTVDNLAIALKSQNRFAEAQPFYEEALAIRKSVLGEDHPVTITSIQNLAIFHGVQGNYEAAEPYFLAALKGSEKTFGRTSARSANAMTAYAVLLGRMGRTDEAIDRYRVALTIQEKALGPTHPQTVNTLYNLGAALANSGRKDEALPVMQRSVERQKVSTGIEHADYADHLGGLAVTESDAGLHEQAESDIREAVALDLKHRGATHRRYAVRLGQLGRILLAKGSYMEADSILTKALDIHVDATSADHPETLTMLDALGVAKLRNGDLVVADSLLKDAYRKRLERLGAEHYNTKSSLLHLAELEAARRNLR